MRKILVLSPLVTVLLAVTAAAQQAEPESQPANAAARVAKDAKDRAAVVAVMKEGQAALQDENFEAAIAAFRKATELEPQNGRAWHLLGYSLHGSKRLDEALKVHLKATEFKEVAHIATYNVACVYSLKGDKKLALEWLQKAVALGFNDKNQVANDPDFDNLRDDPAFKQLVASLAEGVQPFVVTTDRRSARVAYFSGNGSPGQLAIDYGVVEWNDKRFGEALASPKFVGRKWRLGSDFWTTLDTSMPLRINGVEIPAGYWYLTVEHKGDQKLVLGVHDPVAVRSQHIDPFRAELVKGGIEVPMTYARTADVQKQLDIGITLPSGAKTKGSLHVRFGPHELTADVEIGLGSK